MLRCDAISLFDRPRSTSRATSRSRAVSERGSEPARACSACEVEAGVIADDARQALLVHPHAGTDEHAHRAVLCRSNIRAVSHAGITPRVAVSAHYYYLAAGASKIQPRFRHLPS